MSNVRFGFTLVELVITMVLLGILSTVSSKFIVDGMEMYVEANTVQKTNANLNFVTLKLQKLVSNSVPNSLKINSSGDLITFALIKSAFGYFYVEGVGESGGFQMPYLYVVKSPFYTLDSADNIKVAFSGSSGENYYSVSKIENVDTNLYKLTIDYSGNFSFLSETRRLYVVDASAPFVSICYDGNESQLKIYYHNSVSITADVCKSGGETIADNLTNVVFRKIEGAYNPYGEVEIFYSFNYAGINADGSISQRVGVRNAP